MSPPFKANRSDLPAHLAVVGNFHHSLDPVNATYLSKHKDLIFKNQSSLHDKEWTMFLSALNNSTKFELSNFTNRTSDIDSKPKHHSSVESSILRSSYNTKTLIKIIGGIMILVAVVLLAKKEAYSQISGA